ncbi:hypothetical protein E0Z10_g8244 [Xylaria hypoxylon]|uniref:DNA topoisomerase (ATP-hydrolyzing) n=1 Tax=Xylaria hypoxylon TaxID=37992 RepID=A0A4Z0YSN9_9PEZI|nr:hypothetical protein E0Z10_g8244 [Xylaria hypoxylon]
MEGLLHSSRSAFGSSSPLPAVGFVNPSQPDFVLHQDSRRNPQTGVAISKIEEILVANIDALKEVQALTIPLRSRRTGRMRLVRFPSSRDSDAKKFIDQRNHRAIYYQNPELFGSQRYVDELVDDIAFTFGLGRDALNIVAASKGLIAGAVSVTINNGSMLYCNPHDGQGVLLPDVRAISSVNLGATKWLLVIEKEATFRGLVASRFHETSTVGPGILVTAKGYPDLSTRQFLHKLHTSFPILPMYGLVDFDPDGVKIMLTYKNGSRSLQHEQNATLNRLLWIGPRSNDILGDHLRGFPSANIDETCVLNHTPSDQFLSSQSSAPLCPIREFSPVDVMLPLKAADRKLAVRLLSATIGKGDQCIESQDVVRELQVMLMLNTKAEIQAVDEAGDLTAWQGKAASTTAQRHQPAVIHTKDLERGAKRKKMAPKLSEEEIDDLIYLARAGDDADLTEMLQELAVRDASTAADILAAAREEQTKATCLHMAAANGHAKTVTLILSYLPVPVKASVTAAAPAASEEANSAEATTRAEPAYINAHNSFGNTALHWACLGGHLDTVKLLLSRGASPAIANDKDQIPLDLAAFNNHMHVVDHFLAQSRDIEGENALEDGLAKEAQDLDLTEDKNAESGG